MIKILSCGQYTSLEKRVKFKRPRQILPFCSSIKIVLNFFFFMKEKGAVVSQLLLELYAFNFWGSQTIYDTPVVTAVSHNGNHYSVLSMVCYKPG